MADLCVCGHEEREHSRPARPRGGCEGSECACLAYRRSPLSAFRGPRVSFTREEAAGWLRALGFRFADISAAVRWFPAARLREEMRTFVSLARAHREHGNSHTSARCYLAARILRAVRP